MSENNDNGSELVELTAVQGDIEAKILTGILESEDIKVLVKSDMASGTLPFTVDGMGQVKLFVLKEDLVKARVVLREYRKDD